MHHVPLDDSRTLAVVAEAADRGGAVFVHCGALTIGVRKKLGLPSPFDLRLGDPLAVARLAAQFPSTPFIVPHFGAGAFREALMAADTCANVYFDTSSSNGWVRYHPGLTLAGALRAALAVVGPSQAAVRHRLVVLSPGLAARRSSTSRRAPSTSWAFPPRIAS